MNPELLGGALVVILTTWICAKIIAREWFAAKRRHNQNVIDDMKVGELTDVS